MVQDQKPQGGHTVPYHTVPYYFEAYLLLECLVFLGVSWAPMFWRSRWQRAGVELCEGSPSRAHPAILAPAAAAEDFSDRCPFGKHLVDLVHHRGCFLVDLPNFLCSCHEYIWYMHIYGHPYAPFILEPEGWQGKTVAHHISRIIWWVRRPAAALWGSDCEAFYLADFLAHRCLALMVMGCASKIFP